MTEPYPGIGYPLLVEADYTVIFFAAGARHNPGWNWVWKAYRSLNRKYRKNLKKLVSFVCSLLPILISACYCDPDGARHGSFFFSSFFSVERHGLSGTPGYGFWARLQPCITSVRLIVIPHTFPPFSHPVPSLPHGINLDQFIVHSNFFTKSESFSTSTHVGSTISDGRVDQCYSHSRVRSSAPSSSGKSRTSTRSLNSHDMSHSLRSIYPRLSTSKRHPSRVSGGYLLHRSLQGELEAGEGDRSAYTDAGEYLFCAIGRFNGI